MDKNDESKSVLTEQAILESESLVRDIVAAQPGKAQSKEEFLQWLHEI